MPTGASPKREREYKKIERKMKKEGRYKGREEEVAARIVNKQRAAKGETKEAAHRHKPPRRSASRRKTRTPRAAPKRS
jgi:membrane-bound ClpP family serine protease